MRLLGNYGSVHVGAFAILRPFSDWYWNRRWTMNYKACTGKTMRTLKLSDEDLSALYVKGQCKKGSLVLKMSQDSVTKDIDLSGGYDAKIDMTGFQAGLIKMVLVAEKATSIKVVVEWRR